MDFATGAKSIPFFDAMILKCGDAVINTSARHS